MFSNVNEAPLSTQENEDFVPSSVLVPEEDADTLCVDVPGFRKEHMTVQLARKVILKISGRRPVGQKKYQRFHMEFPDELINDATKGAASDLLAKLKTPSKVINMTLVAILILGIGGYVTNAMKSSKKF